MSQYKPYQEDELLLDTEELNENKLVLYNDDVNTFDWVIESLIKVCQHQREQAEQCSLIVHYNGRCSVKEGTREKLRPLCEALHERGLTANIE